MSETSAAKAPDAKTGKMGGGFHAPPPPDKPKEWTTLPVMLQYKDNGGIFEFRVVAKANLSNELREKLHDQHGIAAVTWDER